MAGVESAKSEPSYVQFEATGSIGAVVVVGSVGNPPERTLVRAARGPRSTVGVTMNGRLGRGMQASTTLLCNRLYDASVRPMARQYRDRRPTRDVA